MPMPKPLDEKPKKQDEPLDSKSQRFDAELKKLRLKALRERLLSKLAPIQLQKGPNLRRLGKRP